MTMLLEDIFKEKVEQTYDTFIKGKVPFELNDFDRDALQLGVIYELGRTQDFKQALYHAMFHLSRAPHCYDEVDDYGSTAMMPRTNQITWTGGAVQRLA